MTDYNGEVLEKHAKYLNGEGINRDYLYRCYCNIENASAEAMQELDSCIILLAGRQTSS